MRELPQPKMLFLIRKGPPKIGAPLSQAKTPIQTCNVTLGCQRPVTSQKALPGRFSMVRHPKP